MLYEGKNMHNCRVRFYSDGSAVLTGLRENLPQAKVLLNNKITKLIQDHDEEVTKLKDGLQDFQLISAEVLDVSKIHFELGAHRPIQVASYQTRMGESPYIVIPAMPGYYREPVLPVDLTGAKSEKVPTKEDYKLHFSYNIERVLIACSNLMKEFSLNNYDFVTERNNFRQLLSWALGDEPLLRIDFEKYGNCLIMSRYDIENSKAERINPISVYFEGQCFGKGSNESDNTIIDFDFGGKRILMKCEIDGQLDCTNYMDKLPSEISTMSFMDKEKKSYKGSNVKFIVHGEQKRVPIVELKSAAMIRYKNGDVKDDFVSMWFQSYIAGVEDIVIGLKEKRKLDSGRKKLAVTDIFYKKVNDLIENEDPQRITASICKIIALLTFVEKKMKEGDGIDKASVMYDPKTSELLFCRRDGDSCMPPHYPFQEK